MGSLFFADWQNAMAEMVRAKVACGDYAGESEVVHDGLLRQSSAKRLDKKGEL